MQLEYPQNTYYNIDEPFFNPTDKPIQREKQTKTKIISEIYTDNEVQA